MIMNVFPLTFHPPWNIIYTMKHIKGIAIIFIFTGIGQVLSYFIPAPVPPAIYGMVLLLLSLILKIVKLEDVKTVGDTLISLMPLMFIGPSVRIMTAFTGREGFIPVFLVIAIVSLYLVMIVTGLLTQWLRKGKNDE